MRDAEKEARTREKTESKNDVKRDGRKKAVGEKKPRRKDVASFGEELFIFIVFLTQLAKMSSIVTFWAGGLYKPIRGRTGPLPIPTGGNPDDP